MQMQEPDYQRHLCRVQDYIDSFFGQHVGRFLDIGACRLANNNMTRLLGRGWQGVMLDPIAHNVLALEQELVNQGWRAQVTLVRAALVTDDHATDSVTMHDSIDITCHATWGSASVQPGWVERALKPPDWDGRTHSTTVPALTCTALLDQHGSCWDLVKIDAEGLTTDLLRRLLRQGLQAKLICMELESYWADLVPELADLGHSVREMIDHDLLLSPLH